MSTPSDRRSVEASCIDGSNSRNWFLPDSFAWYIAMSAARSMSVERVRPAELWAMPMLPPSRIDRSGSTNGSSSAARARGATVAASLLVDVVEEDRELVAAEAPGRVLRADDREEPLGDHREHGVGVDMAERVVDGLEVVEVDEQDGRCPGRAGDGGRGRARGGR